jgi:hypothetical protein
VNVEVDRRWVPRAKLSRAMVSGSGTNGGNPGFRNEFQLLMLGGLDIFPRPTTFKQRKIRVDSDSDMDSDLTSDSATPFSQANRCNHMQGKLKAKGWKKQKWYFYPGGIIAPRPLATKAAPSSLATLHCRRPASAAAGAGAAEAQALPVPCSHRKQKPAIPYLHPSTRLSRIPHPLPLLRLQCLSSA